MKNQLKAVFNSTATLPSEEVEYFFDHGKEKQLDKGELFIREGDIPTKLAFVGKGLFRYYYIDKSGNDFTKGFLAENEFLVSYSAMIHNRPAYFNIEAMESAELFVIRYDVWKTLTERNLEWLKVTNALLTKGFCKKEDREREFLLLDASERYTSFSQNYPNLEHRIKQHYIASYLGITPVALSRIRKKMGLLT